MSGYGVARSDFIQRALLCASSAAPFPAPGEIDILKDTNLREGLPSSSARIVSVLRAGSKTRVTGFTLQGESVKGNSAWYLSENDNFFWAGNSSFPQPRPEPGRTQLDVETTVPSESPASETAVAPPAIPITFPLGVAEIDGFFANASCPPLELAKGSRDAVGIIVTVWEG